MDSELKNYNELPIGGVITRADAVHPRTGSWRTKLKPRVQVDKCVNCLICWVDCPDVAVVLEGESFFGFDYNYCKGCELCAEVCPANAIEMVDERSDVPEWGRVEAEEATA